jgi:hypothetical protein
MNKLSLRARATRLAIAAVTMAATTFGVVVTDLAVTGQPALAASSVGGQITRSEALARAQYWVDQNVVYGTTATSTRSAPDSSGRNYRTDCSGLVSMAWHLSDSLTTYDFARWSGVTDIQDPDDMRPADAILFSGHIEMFARWKNASDHTQGAYTYSLNGPADADWAKGPTPNSHGQVGTASYSEIVNNRRLQYNNIIEDVSGTASVYGVLADGRLTYSTIDAATGNRTKTVISTATIGFTPKAMATLNFNTILITDTGGELYRIDVITNNTSLGYKPAVRIASGWTHDLLTYDGNTHLFGIADGTLRRYTVSATKPTGADLSSGQLIDTGFALTTLTATASNWLLGNTADGTLRSYKIVGTDSWSGYTLKTGWYFTHLMSPGSGVYYGHTSSGGMYHYLDADPFDGSGADLAYFGNDPVDTSGWTQILLSTQPATV